jgi:HD-GYP domain-containing protein (c-di-GMP phosphodiesterase class II)
LSQEKALPILFIGLDKGLIDRILTELKFTERKVISTYQEFEAEFENLVEGAFSVAICGTDLGLSVSLEVAQLLMNQCPSLKRFVVCKEVEGFSRQHLKKNGFSEPFILPLDFPQLLDFTIRAVADKGTRPPIYKSVSVTDIQAGTVVEFDTYLFLPLNKKYVKYMAANEPVPPEKVEKLNAHKHGSIFINAADMDKFVSYTASCMMGNTTEANPMSATERAEKAKSIVREIFHEIYDVSEDSDIESGREVLSRCMKLVSQYITGGKSNSWYNDLVKRVSGGIDDYAHATEVSVLAAMIAIGIGQEKPEDLAVAGFLHDISLVDLPEGIEDLPLSSFDSKIQEQYKQHPNTSVQYLRKKRLAVMENVQKAMAEHHERADGKGFPKGLDGDRISLEGQILSFAHQFQKMMVQKMGEKKNDPEAVFASIAANGSIRRDVLNQISSVFGFGKKSAAA